VRDFSTIVSLTPFDIHRLIACKTINIPFKARKTAWKLFSHHSEAIQEFA